MFIEAAKKKIFYLVIAICLAHCPLISAEEKLTVGVAANFMLPFQDMAHEFEEKFNVSVNATYTTTGSLYAQIKNGAPYDLFLAADEAAPERLSREGLAEAPFVYGRGRAVLWTAKRHLCSAQDWQKALMVEGVNRISIAKPETAPYGAVSMAALKAVGLMELIKDKLVFAQDVTQSFQYAHTESVDLAFCALSSAFSDEGKKGCYFPIDQAPVIVQKACVLKGSKKREIAQAFAGFLCSPEVQAVKMKYGYE